MAAHNSPSEAGAAMIRNSIIAGPEPAPRADETAVVEILVNIPCSAAEVQDAIAIIAGQTGDPSEVAVEVVAKYDTNFLIDRPAGLRISRNVSHLVGTGTGDEGPTL